MKYEINGLSVEDIIGPSETKTFQIVVSYQDGTNEVPSENTVTFEMRYVFEIVQVTPQQTGNIFASYLKSIANPMEIDSYENGTKTEMYTFKHEATEQTGELTDYRYIGDSPNNYVYFNCRDDSNVETCEKWRIIGVFPVEDENGKIEDRIKIIRDDSLTRKKMWSNANNNWEIGTLNEYLKETYYDGLSDADKAMIGNTKYYLGGNSEYKNLGGPDYYKFERGTEIYKGDSIIRPTFWVGKIALMYPSDYVYTYALGVDDTCYTDGSHCYTSAGGSPSSGWLFNSDYQRTLSTNSSDSHYAFLVYLSGFVTNSSHYITMAYGVRPTLYLSSSVNIVDGDGSSGNPYQLSI